MLRFAFAFLTIFSIHFPPLWGEQFVISLTSSERYAITEIISSMGEKNFGQLLLDNSRLTGLGNSIAHVPPLQFLGFILGNSHLKNCLTKIANSYINYIKWFYFLDGFGNNMDKEYSEGRLFKDLPGFAKLVRGNLRQLEIYSHQRDWNQFVRSLL